MKTYKYKFLSAATLLAGSFFGSPLSAEDDYLSEDELFNEEIQAAADIYDPLEPINRVTFQVNDFILLNVLQPVADTYTWITPDPVEEGAKNFFRNIRYPIRLTGNLLQARWGGAWHETKRFAVNSTVGIGGILRPADSMEGLQPISPEGVAQAFGAWGIGEGPFLVLPLLGPSNVRDAFGLFGDAAAHPLREPFSAISSLDWEWETAIRGTEFIVASPSLLEGYKNMKGSAIDPYGSVKNAYTQYTRKAIAE